MIKSMNDCIFCKIVAGEIPSRQIWSDQDHIAFLTSWPNTPGFSVVIPKQHIGSYFADVDQEVVSSLVKAAGIVAKKIDAAFDDVGRTGLIFEGFGVDHLHAKLVPMHGTADEEWKKRSSVDQNVFYETYPGYISSHDADEADASELDEIASKIRD